MISQDTCWTLIRAAAAGDARARSAFARSYLPVIRAYLLARWSNSHWIGELDDAIQEVFIECLRADGVVQHADPAYAGGFHALLQGTVRNVALRIERDRARRLRRVPGELSEPERVPADEATLSQVFDRAFAQRLLEEAADRQRANARASGEAALRRVEILRLHFQDDLPIRTIAERLEMDSAVAHHQLAQAKKEFHRAMREVVLYHDPNSTQVDRECRRLLELIG